MKKINYCLLISFSLLMACSASKKVVGSNASATTVTTVTKSTAIQDGSSFENAVVIEAQSERQGITAEHVWINKNYPGAKTESQSLQNRGKNAYDILKIVTADGTTKSIYFNITNFFGKF